MVVESGAVWRMADILYSVTRKFLAIRHICLTFLQFDQISKCRVRSGIARKSARVKSPGSAHNFPLQVFCQSRSRTESLRHLISPMSGYMTCNWTGLAGNTTSSV